MIAAYVIKQYERAVVFKLGKVKGPARGPGLIFIVPSRRAGSADRAGDPHDRHKSPLGRQRRDNP